MDITAFLIAGVSLCVAGGAWWSVRRLQREISRVAREQYYLEQKLNALPRSIESAVEPLRFQTAWLARGRGVSDLLIKSGKLFHELNGTEALQLLEHPAGRSTMFVLDVRTKSEYGKQRIPGAKLIPVEELEERHRAEIPPDAEKILVYCAAGDRSRLACEFLSRQDYGNIYFLKNGLPSWPGPLEGDQTGPLIQITSKSAGTPRSSSTISSSAHP